MKELSVAVTIFAFVVGVWIGAESYDQAWKKDCDALGAHRTQTLVYQCKKANQEAQDGR